MDNKPLSELTNGELLAHVEGWVKSRKEELTNMSGQSLTDVNILAATAKGSVQDIGKIFALIEAIIKRIPER